MAVATHNTDLGDGFEREAYGEEYFETYSKVAYAMGVNIVVYAERLTPAQRLGSSRLRRVKVLTGVGSAGGGGVDRRAGVDGIDHTSGRTFRPEICSTSMKINASWSVPICSVSWEIMGLIEVTSERNPKRHSACSRTKRYCSSEEACAGRLVGVIATAVASSPSTVISPIRGP